MITHSVRTEYEARLRDLEDLWSRLHTQQVVARGALTVNSRDRRLAAEAVVRTLVDKGAIGAISTHDISLTEFAEALGGANVHMGSRDGSDPMDFDYSLKSGIAPETNALAIARMAGVPL